MEENRVTEKVYCYDHPSAYNNNDALAIAAMANANKNNGCDPMTAAMMSGGGMGGWNNPFVYLVWMMFANRMWDNGGNKVQDAEIQAQLNALRTQLSDNQNTQLLNEAVKGNGVALGQLSQNLNCDFNQLQNAVCGIRASIKQVAGQIGYSAERVINAANLGDLNIVQQLKDCCCQTQQSITRMGYENQLGQKDILNGIQQQTNTFERSLDFVNRSVERGFSAIGYQNAQDKCDIIRAGSDNTQRIIDTLNAHWREDLQQRYNDARLELSQQRQNATLIAALKTTTTTPTA